MSSFIKTRVNSMVSRIEWLKGIKGSPKASKDSINHCNLRISELEDEILVTLGYEE